MYKLLFVFLALCFFFAPSLSADEPAIAGALGESNEPLARQGDVVLTQAEIDAALSKIPSEIRLAFIRDGQKVESMIRNLLTTKILAEEARKAGYDKDTLQVLRMQMAAEAELAKDWIEKVVDEAPEVDLEPMAYEDYLLNPDAWKTPETVDVSHILISTREHSAQEANELALGLWEQLQEDPALFDGMVLEYSEDPSASRNKGSFSNVKRGDMVKPFEEAAFSMENPGQISAPVETNYGFHIIRLDAYNPGIVPPFDAVKEKAIAQARKQYREKYRNDYLAKLINSPIVIPDGADAEMAKRYFGDDLELAPVFED